MGIDRKGSIEKLEIRDEKIIGEVAELTVLVAYGNGSTETEKVKLVKEEGGWRIEMGK